jgi:hypothetical protein
MKFSTIPAILAFATTTLAACYREGSVQLTFYGYPDNDPPSANTAYNCGGRNYVAGGIGTYDDPLTMASAQGEFNRCETIYVPYLEKYVRCKSTSSQTPIPSNDKLTGRETDEDYCQQCTDDFKSGKHHIDVFTGSSKVSGGQEQINCEDRLTPDGDVVIVRNPDSSYAVDYYTSLLQGMLSKR